ncbi:MAG TPA: FCD domain-containing protein [Mycobacterium sp.]|nr:FCD domain-containing protein [Mycobacterium sp.]
MTILGIGAEAHRRLSSRRTAEIVADELRQQIIDGRLADGDLLPGQKQLVEHFNVSLVSVREALRILETEGLVSVRRGNRGGAVVHTPAKSSAAYMLGLVLQSDSVPVTDLRTALTELEPSCAALAARRPDRETTLIPDLVQSNEAMAANLNDPEKFSEIGREFHHVLALGCGNHTMVVVMGSLEALWTSQEGEWFGRAKESNAFPTATKRRTVLNAHIKLTKAIADGDVDLARRLAYKHIGDAHTHALPGSDQRIQAHSPQSMSRRP